MSDRSGAIAAALLVAALAVLLATIDPAFFIRDDMQLEFLPGSKDAIDAFKEGSFPLLSRHSWLCAGLAAEYQFGVFSLFRMLLEGITWLLPLSLIARGTFLFIAHAAVAGAGGYLLARSYGVRPAHAVMVALIAGLNGWTMWWGSTWHVSVASFAWLPWYWLALRKRSLPLIAITLYLIITAGAPFGVGMAAFVAAMNFVTALVRKEWRGALVMVTGSTLGLALAAPAVLMLLEYFSATVRATVATAIDPAWNVPIRALFGLIVPAFTTKWSVFGTPMSHAAVELLGPFVPLAAIAVSVRRLRAYVPEVVVTLVLLALIVLPSGGPFRWSFRWLPLFLLLLAILGACVLEHARRVWAAGLALLVITAAVAMDKTTIVHAGVLAVLCVAWVFLPSWKHAMPAIITAVAIVITFVGFSHETEVPVWAYDDDLLAAAPLDPSRRYLAMYNAGAFLEQDESGRLRRGVHPELRPGNLSMMSGLEFVNAYSPMRLTGLVDLFRFGTHGQMPAERAESLLVHESGSQQLLHHIGIDGLIVPEWLARRHAEHLSRSGWRPAMKIASCVVFHRDERTPEPLFAAQWGQKAPDAERAYAAIVSRSAPQLPVVLLTPGMSANERYGRRTITRVEVGRNHTSFEVAKGPKALIVFRRPWLPGWRAAIDGKPLPVLRAHLIMPAIEIPADASGAVQLVYRPRSLTAGVTIAAIALIVLIALTLRARRAQ